MKRPIGWAWTACVAASLTMAGCARPASSPYDALARLPDWSGWWATDNSHSPLPWLRPLPPFKPVYEAKVQAVLQLMKAGADLNAVTDQSAVYCRPRLFTGIYILGLEALAEFMFTPGRVTVSSEWGDIRRIDTDGRRLPADPDASKAGTSVGHWEGQTLVVNTVGLDPHAEIGLPGYPNIPIGEKASSLERISLADKDHLRIETVLTAPDVLTGPFHIVNLFKREPGHVFHEYSTCAAYDRAIDPASGKQRFDTTPPPDLPPPPAR